MNPQTYLEKFTSDIDTSGFCLAHLFTYKDFPGGVAGFGWIGKLCSPSHNTGFTTFLNHEVSTYLKNTVIHIFLNDREHGESNS